METAFLFFEQHILTALLIKSYLSSDIILMASFPSNFSAYSIILSDFFIISSEIPAFSTAFMSRSKIFIEYHLFLSDGTVSFIKAEISERAFSVTDENFIYFFLIGFSLASIKAVSIVSINPVPFSADISITGQPKRPASFFMFMLSPFFCMMSIIFKVITMGFPSSDSCVVRYRFLSRFIASARFIITAESSPSK